MDNKIRQEHFITHKNTQIYLKHLSIKDIFLKPIIVRVRVFSLDYIWYNLQ